MEPINVQRREGITDAMVQSSARSLLLTGRVLAWLERARLCVMAGTADYERGYENLLALANASLDAREAYDEAMDGALSVFDGPVAQGLTREQMATAVPRLLEYLLRPPAPEPKAAGPTPPPPAEAPPENKEG